MIEREMGYRGSKSVVGLNKYINHKSIAVKEQRVDGSWYGNNLPCLRCTLMDFERNYQVKILSKQTNIIRTYSTISTHKPLNIKESNMNPWFFTGFADAESSFSILIQHNETYKTNWRVKAIFAIGLHNKDVEILEHIQSFLGVGKIHKHGVNSVQYRIESINGLQVVLDHFDKYPLVTAKLADYILFKKALNIMRLQEHLTEKGLLTWIGIKFSMNLGLNNTIKEAFPNWEQYKVNRPEYTFNSIPDPNWVAGFSSGDGSFNIKISNTASTKIGTRVPLRFAIGLNIREEELIKSLVSYFNLNNKEGKMSYVYCRSNSVSIQIISLTDIRDTVIPFFVKYPIQGQKAMDFSDFCKVVNMISNKEHLTLEGFNRILEIKASMNEERK